MPNQTSDGRWLINASPLICLAKAGQANILWLMPDEMIIPQAVVDEIEAGLTGDPAREALQSGKFIVAAVQPLPEILAWDLGRGETGVLSYALDNQGWTAIIDDLAARKCARSFSIQVKGTLAVVILAKQRQLIPSAGAVLRSLQAAGLRLDDAVIREALQKTVKESW